MRVALDIRPALRQGTGVGTFVEELARALDAAAGDHRLKLFTSSYRDRWDQERLRGLERSEIVDRRWPVRVLNTLWHWVGMPRIESLVGEVDIAHSPTPLRLPTRGASVVTLHDLYFLSHPEHTHSEMRRDYGRLVEHHCRRADRVMAVSQSTASDAVNHLGIDPAKIRVCHSAAAPFFAGEPHPQALAEIETLIPVPFFLYVGTIEPRKNVETLIRAFDRLTRDGADAALVIAGARGWDTGAFDRSVDELEHKDRLVLSGYRTRSFVRALYHRAVALVLPSHCEGFGLPLVEAMACGCPVVAADNSAMPEITGGAAELFDAVDEERLAAILGRLLNDTGHREDLAARARLRHRDFSWERTAEQVLDLYRELLGA